ncbi:MAG: hypothetical protein RR506_04925 [Akkermansia sp.]
MNVEIGGFFGLELPDYDNFPHREGGARVLLNSGRCALEYILRSLGDVQRVYLSYYTCATVLEPLVRLGIPYGFYRIDEQLEIIETSLPQLQEGEYVIYTHYFGVKEAYLDVLAQRHCGHLIVDNTLALYSRARQGVPSFYSPRKFSGVADGGVVMMADASLSHEHFHTIPLDAQDKSSADSLYLMERIESGAEVSASACERSELSLRNALMQRMSPLTERLIRGIDYEAARERRMSNFMLVHARLKDFNKLYLDTLSMSAPFCYPLWTNMIDLRNELIDKGILIPFLWTNVPEMAPPDGVEQNLAYQLLPLPIDQRYSCEEMEYVIHAVESFYR